MKELCFIMYQFQIGGCEQIFLKLADSMKNKINLITVTPNYNPKLVEELPENVKLLNHKDIPVLSCFQSILKLPGGGVLYTLLAMLIIPGYLRKLFRHQNVQFVNFSDTLSSIYIAVKSSINNKAISWIHCRPSALKNSKSYIRYVSLLKKCKTIVFICNAQSEEFLYLEDMPKDVTCEVIYNPVDKDSIIKKGEQSVPVEKPYLCMVSRLDERSKDFKTPIIAYSQLPDNITNKVDLLIVGEGQDKPKIERYIEEVGLKNKIKLVGTDPNPYRWMKNSELFIFSSKNEGFGLVILEALACGKYVIATDCPVGPAEILLNNQEKCGTLVPVGDVEGIKNAIVRYYEHPESVKTFINNAAKRLGDFSLESFRIKLNNLFNS